MEEGGASWGEALVDRRICHLYLPQCGHRCYHLQTRIGMTQPAKDQRLRAYQLHYIFSAAQYSPSRGPAHWLVLPGWISGTSLPVIFCSRSRSFWNVYLDALSDIIADGAVLFP